MPLLPIQPSEPGWQPDASIWIALASAMAAAAAVGTAVYNGWRQRKHDRMSVRPYLCVDGVYPGGEGPAEVFVVNQGLGPALIQSVRLFIDGREIASEAMAWLRGFESVGLPKVTIGFLRAGTAIQAKGRESLLRIDTPHAPTVAVGFARLRFEIDYHSFYGPRDFKSTAIFDAEELLGDGQREQLARLRSLVGGTQ